MMRIHVSKAITTLLVTLPLAVTCHADWSFSDGSKPSASQLAEAKKLCQVDEKLEQLSGLISSPKSTSSFSLPDSKKKLAAEYDAKKQATSTEINNCMKKAGLEQK